MEAIKKSVSEFEKMAVNACRMISMDPERMGHHICIECSEELDEFLANIPEELREEYEAKYLNKWREWLAALSRCYSVLVTGPARFNSRRHEKMNDYERAARQRLRDWSEKVVKRINRQQRLTGWQEVERLQSKLDTLTELHDKMKAANKIVRSKKMSEEEQIDELVALGLNEKQAVEILKPTERCYAAAPDTKLARRRLRNLPAAKQPRQNQGNTGGYRAAQGDGRGRGQGNRI